MMVPYLHVLRRFFRYRHWGHMIVAAMARRRGLLAFLLTLLHCRGRANGYADDRHRAAALGRDALRRVRVLRAETALSES